MRCLRLRSYRRRKEQGHLNWRPATWELRYFAVWDDRSHLYSHLPLEDYAAPLKAIEKVGAKTDSEVS